MKDTKTPIVPEKLKIASEKSGIPIAEICTSVYAYKEEELRFRDIKKKDERMQVEELQIKIKLRELFIMEDKSAKEYNEYFSGKKVDTGQKTVKWFNKFKIRK